MTEADAFLAAELLEEYLQACVRGQQPDTSAYLVRCPRSAAERLRLAMEGVDFALQGYGSDHVKESTVQRTWEQIQEIQRKRHKLAEVHARARQDDHVPPEDPGSYLARLLGAPTVALAIQAAAQTARSHPELGPWDPTAGRSSTQKSLRESELQLQVLECEIAQQANELLERLQIKTPPVDIFAIAQHFNLFVKEAGLEGMDGCLVTHNDMGATIINSQATNGQRKRFALAHETGHYVRHRHLRMQFRDTLGEWGSLLYDQEEFEADTFAAMLLMPDCLLSVNLSSERPSLALANDLAQRFDVPLAMALRRMVRASQWRCALAILKNEVIECWIRSPELNGYARKLQSPPSASLAAWLTLSEKEPEASITLPAEEWFGGPIAEESVTVLEQSQRVNSDYIYSLISVVQPD